MTAVLDCRSTIVVDDPADRGPQAIGPARPAVATGALACGATELDGSWRRAMGNDAHEITWNRTEIRCHIA
ncbi:hypothetical protein C5E43_20900 [Nocardia cyriacigeorgica]|nr:hypothetical protein C5B73_23400 [Nocardia cyriacigeorgica]PPJ05983.1 hypothetical protein C5E43_20900 [Nocardia cyriacigeorgica]